MKKFLALFLIICFTCLSAEATYSVHYNNAGVSPAIVRSRFGANAGFTPRNQARAAARKRMIAREEAITKAIANSNMGRPNAMVTSRPVSPQSRFDRNYNTIRVQKTYTKNGITYYN